MTTRRSAKASQPQPIEPLEILRAATTWSDAAGNLWEVACHWTVIGGRATLIGMDIRSFRDEARPVGAEVAELTQRVVRGIPIAAIREATRAEILEDLPSPTAMPFLLASARRHPSVVGSPSADETVALIARRFADAASAFTAAGTPRKRTPSAGSEVLSEVARLYLATLAAGDKQPAKTIEAQLRAAGWPVSERGGRDQVRKWIQRARQRGLIPPVR